MDHRLVDLNRFLVISVLAGASVAAGVQGRGRQTATRLPAEATGKGKFEEIDAYIEAQMQRLKIPGVSLAIVEGEQVMHLGGFGRSRPGGSAPSAQTPFFICSLTKSVTALAVMQLVEAGTIELDAPVQRYLSWFRVADPQASAEITVRHLLHQTSGLPASAGEMALADFDDSPDAGERQARELVTMELAHPVGAAFEYSNANYNVLGLIIEAATGEGYAKYVEKRIFSPLGMDHTTASLDEARQDGLALGHRYWFGRPVAVANMPLPHGSLPSGQLISTAEDMARYLLALLNGGRYGEAQVLSRAGIAELQRGAAAVQVMGLSLGQYGMGWFVDEIGGKKLVWHSGTNPDFAAYMALLPEQKKGIVLLFNADHHWMNPVLSDFGGRVTALLAGEKPAPVPFVGLIPWVLRGLLVIPAFQIAGVVATLWLSGRWRRYPERRPAGGRKWMHVLLPLVPNLLIASSLRPMLGTRRRYLQLYMPDVAWITQICGSLALVWSVVRTRLILGAWRRRSAPAGGIGSRGDR